MFPMEEVRSFDEVRPWPRPWDWVMESIVSSLVDSMESKPSVQPVVLIIRRQDRKKAASVRLMVWLPFLDKSPTWLAESKCIKNGRILQ